MSEELIKKLSNEELIMWTDMALQNNAIGDALRLRAEAFKRDNPTLTETLSEYWLLP